MNVNKIIKEILTENEVYDKILKLDDWHSDEQSKIDKITDFKKWKYYTDRHTKIYFNKRNELTKEPDAFSLGGNMKSNFIYHYTDYDALKNILTDNIMYTGENGISYSSNSNLYKRGFIFWHASQYSKGKNHTNIGIKMKFDFNLMKQDKLKFRSGNENMGTSSGENEIRLMIDELENPIKYISEVIVFKSKEENYQEAIEILNNYKIKNRLV